MIVTAHTHDDWLVFRAFAAKRDYFYPEVMPRTLRVLGSMVHGQLVGMIEFNQFLKRTCQVHAIGQLTPEILRAVFDYAFRQLGLVQIFGSPPADNHQLLKLLRWLGFEEIHRVKGGVDEFTDCVIMGMHQTQCRFLKEKEYAY